MNQSMTTTLPLRKPHRTTLIAIGLFALFGLALAAGITALVSGGSETNAGRAAPPEVVPAPASTAHLVGNDLADLLATIAAMPPTVQAQVVASLSPELADGLGTLALFVDDNVPVPDNATLGGILLRLDRSDRNAVLSGLPVEQQIAVVAAEESAATASLPGYPVNP